jgi:hypothetical protein
MKIKQDLLGFLDIPIKYQDYSQEEKNVLCDKLIDVLIKYIDNQLITLPNIDRIRFLNDILESSLISNEHLENYEVCSVLRDMQLRLNES